MRNSIFLIPLLAVLAGCASPKTSDRIDFEEARQMFTQRGVQPGQPLPNLSIVGLYGQPPSLQLLQGDRPLVLVTASLTCNVARRQQHDVEELQKRFGNTVAFVVVYTIDAHPNGDPCPYTGKEWVPADNTRDGVLYRQPDSLEDRLALAREYHHRLAPHTIVVVDTMDNATWKALGQAPNLGLLVDRHGIVRFRQGWFDPAAMESAILSPSSGG